MTPRSGSLVGSLLSLQQQHRQKVLDQLSEEEAATLLYDWTEWAHPGQVPPTDQPWFVYLMRSGRGGGKTRAGSEWVHYRAHHGAKSIALIGETKADIRDVMIEMGDSSLLKTAPPWDIPVYEPSKRRLVWKGGAVAFGFSGDEPDQLRGYQFDTAWVDELAKYQYPEETWDNLMFCMRLGDPRVFVTTTPRPIPVLKKILEAKDTIDVRFSTWQNAMNLSPAFLQRIREMYEGTRLGRQELEGEILDDNPKALWKRDLIENERVHEYPHLVRIVVGVDPAVTASKSSDETGIIVAGIAATGHVYILQDASLQSPPLEWARAVERMYRTWRADRVIGEANNGGDLVEVNLRTVDRNIPYKAVHASRGKLTRAEPISSLYEQGKVHHVGTFPALEDQMCLSGDTLIATEQGQVRIDKIQVGQKVWTRKGLFPVIWAGMTSESEIVYDISTSENSHLLATVGHLIYTQNRGFITVANLRRGDVVETWKNMAPASFGEITTLPSMRRGTTGINEQEDYCIGSSGKTSMDLFLQALLFTIKTAIPSTTISLISNWQRLKSIVLSIPEVLQYGPLNIEAAIPELCGRFAPRSRRSVLNVALLLNRQECERSSAQGSVARNFITSVTKLNDPRPVFNLKVSFQPEFYANGILVHNCEWEPGAQDSPDRMDALVWAVWELTERATGGTDRFAIAGITRKW